MLRRTFASLLVLLAPLAAFAAEKPKADPYPLVEAAECRPRAGLPNFFAKLEAGGNVHIAYLGGSITAQDGWRVKTLRWFQDQFPRAKVSEINAAIAAVAAVGGTVLLKAGTYVQAAAIALASNVWLRGEGMTRSIITMAAAATVYHQLYWNGAANNVLLNAIVSDLKIDGSANTYTGASYCKGVYAMYNSNCSFHRLWILNTYGSGLGNHPAEKEGSGLLPVHYLHRRRPASRRRSHQTRDYQLVQSGGHLGGFRGDAPLHGKKTGSL
jgi:hypothetical protein